jgi:hypothetical protein
MYVAAIRHRPYTDGLRRAVSLVVQLPDLILYAGKWIEEGTSSSDHFVVKGDRKNEESIIGKGLIFFFYGKLHTSYYKLQAYCVDWRKLRKLPAAVRQPPDDMK